MLTARHMAIPGPRGVLRAWRRADGAAPALRPIFVDHDRSQHAERLALLDVARRIFDAEPQSTNAEACSVEGPPGGCRKHMGPKSGGSPPHFATAELASKKARIWRDKWCRRHHLLPTSGFAASNSADRTDISPSASSGRPTSATGGPQQPNVPNPTDLSQTFAGLPTIRLFARATAACNAGRVLPDSGHVRSTAANLAECGPISGHLCSMPGRIRLKCAQAYGNFDQLLPVRPGLGRSRCSVARVGVGFDQIRPEAVLTSRRFRPTAAKTNRNWLGIGRTSTKSGPNSSAVKNRCLCLPKENKKPLYLLAALHRGQRMQV